MKNVYKLIVIGLCFTLIGCGSHVQHTQDSDNYAYNGEKYCKVELSINKDATEDPNDIVRFDGEELRNMIERKLGICGLMNEKSVKSVKIEITDIRIRSSFNAFMWGVMAGDDHIEGDIILIGDNGEPQYTFNVSASYALGGFAGMDETRMSWLFEEFSKLAVAEIAGEEATKIN